MMTRLTSTQSQGKVLGEIGAGWGRASKAAAGKAALQSWGCVNRPISVYRFPR
jgi:hypothetical protein